MFKLVVLVCSLALAAAKPGLIYPGYAPGYFAPGYLGAPLAYSQLSLAPGQPAGILGIDGRPLDTLDVNVAKAQHYAAKALDGSGIHLLKKRSVALPLAAPLAYSAPLAYHTPLAYNAPLAYQAPLSYTAPLAYSGYGSPLIRTW